MSDVLTRKKAFHLQLPVSVCQSVVCSITKEYAVNQSVSVLFSVCSKQGDIKPQKKKRKKKGGSSLYGWSHGVLINFRLQNLATDFLCGCLFVFSLFVLFVSEWGWGCSLKLKKKNYIQKWTCLLVYLLLLLFHHKQYRKWNVSG